MPRDPTKIVTDPCLLRELARQGINPDDVDFTQDYAPHKLGKEHGPYSKFYRMNNGGRKRFMVVSGLPMVDEDGKKNEPKWESTGSGKFKEKNNLFKATIDGTAVTLIVRNDQPTGIPKNARLDFSPQLFLNGVEMIGSTPVLLPVDPKNPNYLSNTLEWDYGVCKRHFRQVEGRVHGYWIFASNPGGDVRIKYNQTGDYRLKLGQFKINEDEELIPASVFASASYPFEVSDSATYYPDADAETTSVDGSVRQLQYDQTWATLVGGAGTNAYDAIASAPIFIANGSATSNLWDDLRRAIALFDSSGLPDTATKTAGTISLYGLAKADGHSATPTLNVYASTPASNTALAAGDFVNIGSTAFATAITYAAYSATGYNDWSLNASGLAAISLTGISKFGFRNPEYDVANSAPPWGGDTSSLMSAYFSEQGDGFKPKLVVTYTDVTDYPISASVDMGLAVTTTRTANYPRSPSHALGFAATASRATTISRTASHDLGMAVTAVRTANYPRAPSVSLGFETSVSRATTVSRTSAHDMGYAVTATRTADYPRAASHDMGYAVTASRLVGWGRTASHALGMAVTASRATVIARTASHALGWAVTATRGTAISRTASHTLGYSVTATRTADYPRTSSLAMGFAVTASRLANFPRLASHALGWAVTASRATTVSRLASHALGWAVTVTRNTTVSRTADVAMGYVASATRGFAKIAEVTLGWFVGVVMRPRIHRRVSTTGTNRTISTVGTNRDVSSTGTNRDIETW